MRLHCFALSALVLSSTLSSSLCLGQDTVDSYWVDDAVQNVAPIANGPSTNVPQPPSFSVEPVVATPTNQPTTNGPSLNDDSTQSLLDFEFKLSPVELDISEELIQAKEAYESGRWRIAADAAAAFLKKNPGHKQVPNALFLRGESNMQLKRYEQVIEDFQNLLASNPHPTQRIRAEFRIAEATLLLREYDKAKSLLEAFRRKYPNDKHNAYTITYLGEIIGQTNEPWAKALFAESLQRFPNGPLNQRAKLRLALIRFKEGNFTVARKDLEQLIENGEGTQPEFWTAWYWLGRTELSLNQEKSAIERFLALAEQNPNHDYSAAATFQAAEILRADNNERALELYERIRTDWPDSQYASAAALGQMQAFQQRGENQRALDVFQEQSQFASKQTQLAARQIAAEIYISQKQYERAENLIQPHTVVQPAFRDNEELATYYRSVYLLGLAMRGQGKYSRANELLGRIRLDLVSAELAARTSLARIETFVANTEYDRANQEAIAFEARFPRNKLTNAVHEQWIRSLVQTDHLKEASLKFRRLQSMPQSELYIARSARILSEKLYEAGDLDNARVIFQSLEANQQSNEDLAQALSGLAWIDFKQQNFDSASQRFEQLIDAFPDHPSVWRARLAQAKCLTQQSKPQEAIRTLRPFESLDPSNELRPRGIYQLAELLNDAGKKQDATSLMEELLDAHPRFKHRDAALYFSAMQQRRSSNPEANAKFNELIHEYPSSQFWSDALFRLAESAHAERDNVAANEYLTKLISADRDQSVLPHALFMKGRLESDDKNWVKARDTLRKLLRQFPDSQLVPVARYGVAESFFQEKNFQRAHQLFRLLNEEPQFQAGDTWGAMVQLRLAQLEVHRKNFLEAIKIAERIRSDFPNFALQHEVDYLIGRVAAARGEFSDARSAYDRVVSADSNYEREITAMAQWMIGETYFHQKKYILAIKAYEALVADLEFTNWQAASHLQIGKCYELLGNLSEAEKSYSRVTTTYKASKWAPQAEERLNKLQQSI